LQKLWSEKTIVQGGRLLHVAPEPVLEQKLRLAFDYVSIDLDGENAMQAMDITCLEFADETFSAVVCNHVLEHVTEDRKALSEIYRVLKPEGWASLQVPMSGDRTIEDSKIIDPGERKRLFGQDDHVRMYGNDYIDRLKEAGFEVLVLSREALCSQDMKNVPALCEKQVLLAVKQSK
jgi:SAM-dependent methyltransferase